MDPIFANINDKQKEAILTTEGPLLIIAGAGSGKTRVLTHRVAYLIKQGIDPKNILAVTFTNKSAEEMRRRINNLVKTASWPTIGTFHAVCASILHREITKIGYKPNFTIYGEDDQLSVIKEIMKDFDSDKDSDFLNPASVAALISGAKNELQNPDFYQSLAENEHQQKIAKIYQEYQKWLKAKNILDFDDLILLTVELFQKYPEILEKYQNLFRYISVDEYQDTNHAQYVFINLLAKRYRDLCVIGDSDQAIYQWRGADFRNILNFEMDYPEAKVVMLEENYRSTQNILKAAHHVIVKNVNRKEKKLWTQNPAGARIMVAQAGNEKEEAGYIAKEILRLTKQESLKFSDCTVLFRMNTQSRAIEEALLKCSIPYKIIGTVKFYARKEIKDILAYLRLIFNPEDILSLKRIVNLPPRGLTKLAEEPKPENFFSFNEKGELLLNNNHIAKRHVNSLKNFENLIKKCRQASRTATLSQLLKLVIKESGYENYLNADKREGEQRLENIKELLTVSKKYDNLPPPKNLEKFLEETALTQEADEMDNGENAVQVMTLHSAKGLEFEAVFIAGCEDGLFPHSRSLLGQEEMEEERRLCYVGITRAKKSIYLIFARRRSIFGSTQANPPSRFLLDLPSHLVNYQILEEDDILPEIEVE